VVRVPGSVAVLADIGHASYHVGDEAIAHGAVHQLRQRGVEGILLLSKDPAATLRRFGPHARAVRMPDFPWHPVACQRHWADLRAVVTGIPTGLPETQGADIRAVVDALRDVDALLIAGGGNLNSTWRWLLYERAAVAHIAATLGKPVVI